ncbi:MAG: hypothetical protein AAFY20_19005 [Cyanobacteria bacterium J06639_14]
MQHLTREQKIRLKLNELSDSLYRGEVESFEVAVNVLFEAYGLQTQLSSVNEEHPCAWDEYIPRVRRALEIYRSAISEAEKVASKQMAGEGLSDFAKALDTRDYKGLAW